MHIDNVMSVLKKIINLLYNIIIYVGIIFNKMWLKNIFIVLFYSYDLWINYGLELNCIYFWMCECVICINYYYIM